MLALFYLLLAGLFAFVPAGLSAISGKDLAAVSGQATTAQATGLSQSLVENSAKHKRPRCGIEDEKDKRDNEHRGKKDIEHESKKDHDPKQCPISNE